MQNRTGILCPLASRIEFFDLSANNPFSPKYWNHYPRFTIRLAKTLRDNSISLEVECLKRLRALDDPTSRRYLPLYTFQSLVMWNGREYEVVQTSRVDTVALFEYVRRERLGDLDVGKPSWTRDKKDAYRIVTARKLRASGVTVDTLDFRVHFDLID